VWDLRIVAGRLLARKPVAPNPDVWAFVTRRMGDLDEQGAPLMAVARREATKYLAAAGRATSQPLC
jgi:hypothetical protein